MTSATARICVFVVAVIIAAPAATQTVGPMVASDLNNDGRVERFALIDTGDGSVNLQIENTGGGVIFAENIAWMGGIGQKPELRLAPNGSVLLTAMNEAIGRHRWHMTLTIAYRRDAYRVAGFTYDWYDTIDLADSGLCDLNLLSGNGFVSIGEGAKKPVRTQLKAIPATQWTDSTPIPRACGLEN